MRTALITGGTKGIGLASARHLEEAGWRVIAMARKGSYVRAAAISRAVKPL